MSDLNQILASITTIVQQLNDPSYVKEHITVLVDYGCHTIAVKVYKHHPISKILKACLTKLNLVHANYHIENSIGLYLLNTWPCAILNNHEQLLIKQN